MAKALKVVGKIASVAAVVLAFIPGGQPFAAAASAISGVANAGAALLAQPAPRDQGIEKVTISIDAPSPYVIGRTLTGGVLVHDVGYGVEYKDIPNPNRSLAHVISDCGPIDAIEALYSDGASITANGYAGGYYGQNMHFAKSLGSRPSAALSGPYGSIPQWTSSHKLSGKASALVSLRWDKKQKLFTGGLPKFSFLCRGVKVYDARQDSTYPGGSGPCRIGDETTYVYSENPSAHALTYAYGRYENGRRIYGVGKAIESMDVDAFVEWANVCDANNWKVGGVIDEPGNKWNNLKLIMEAGSAKPTHKGGLLSVYFDAPKVSVVELTEADLADDQATIPAGKSFKDRINSIVPRVRSPQHGYVYIPGTAVTIAQYEADDGELKRKEKQYSLCQDFTHGAQLAAYEIVNSRELSDITLTFKPLMLAYGPGEAVSLNMPTLGLVGQYNINRRRFDPLTATVEITLSSESVGKHSFALGATTTPPETPTLRFGEDYDTIRSAASGRDAALAILNATSWTLDLDITATNAGVATMSAHSRVYSDETIAVDGGTITGLGLNTLYYIYYDDPEGTGGDVTYFASLNEGDAQTSATNPDRHYVGYVTTPAANGAPTTGFSAGSPTSSVTIEALDTTALALAAADAALQGFVDQSVIDLAAADSVLQNSLDQAVVDLSAADDILQASVTNLDQAMISTQGQITQAVSTLEAADAVLQTSIANIDQNLSTTQTQLSDADALLQLALDGALLESESQALSITSLTAETRSVGLTSNGKFDTGDLTGFRALTSNPVTALPSYNGETNVVRSDSGYVPLYTEIGDFLMPVDPARKYRIRSKIHAGIESQRFYIGTEEYDESKVRFTSNKYPGGANFLQHASDGWVERKSNILTGTGGGSLQFTAGTKFVALRALLGFVTGPAGPSYISELWLEDVTDGEAVSSRIDDLDVVTANQATSIAQITTQSNSNLSQITTLNQTASDQAISISEIETINANQASSITSLNETTSTTASSLSDLTTTVDGNSASISTLDTTTATQATSITNLTVDVSDANSRIDSVETVNATQATVISGISTTVSGISSDIVTIQQTDANQAQSITSLESVNASQSASITSLNQTTSSQATSISQIETVNANQASSITSLDQTTSSTASSLASLTTTVDGHTSSISTLDTTTANQATSISTLTVDLGDANNRIDSAEVVNANQASSIASIETINANQASSISTLDTTTANQALSITSLTAETRSVGLTSNGKFDTGDLTGFRKLNGNTTTVLLNYNGETNVVRADSGYVPLYTDRGEFLMPVEHARKYVLRSKLHAGVDGQRFYVGTEEYDENKVKIASNKYPSAANALQNISDGWVERKSNILTGTGGGSLQFTAGTKFVALRALLGFVTGPAGPSYISELWLEDVTDGEAVSSRIDVVETVNASQATAISSLETTSANNTSTISALNTTTASQASTLSSLSTVSSSQSSSINVLSTTTADHASRVFNLETNIQGNNASITTLNSTTNGHAASITTLNANQRATIGFAVNGGSLSLQYVNGVGTTLRADADNIILNGSIQSAHIGALEVDTLHIAGNAVTGRQYSSASNSLNVSFYHNGATTAQGTTILQKTITTTGGDVYLDVDAWFSTLLVGSVGGSSDNMTRCVAYIKIYRGTTLIATRVFGQYLLDGDNTANERAHVLEVPNMAIFRDQPSAGSHTYCVKALVARVTSSATVTGFVPNIKDRVLRITEHKK